MRGPKYVIVYDTPSEMGGSFTVSIKREIDLETVEVRVWYGRATKRAGSRGPIGTATPSRPSATG